MDVEQVVEKILADAKAEVEKVMKAAKQKEAAEQKELDLQLGDYSKQTEALAQKAAEDEKSHILAAARMEIAKQLLAEKRIILDDVFKQARGQLQNLGNEEYYPLMTKLLLGAVETGEEEVLVDKNETRIDQNFIKNVNRDLGSHGRGNLRLAEERLNIGGGFVLRRGKVKTNISYDVLIDQSRKELEIELAKELFS